MVEHIIFAKNLTTDTFSVYPVHSGGLLRHDNAFNLPTHIIIVFRVSVNTGVPWYQPWSSSIRDDTTEELSPPLPYVRVFSITTMQCAVFTRCFAPDGIIEITKNEQWTRDGENSVLPPMWSTKSPRSFLPTHDRTLLYYCTRVQIGRACFNLRLSIRNVCTCIYEKPLAFLYVRRKPYTPLPFYF